MDDEANGVSNGLKVKVEDKHRRDDSPGSSSSSRSSLGHQRRDNRRRKSPDPPDKGNGRDRGQGNSPPSGADGKKPDKGDGKTPDKAERPPAEDGEKPSMPSPAVVDTKRITSSFVSHHLGTYDGTTCLETFLARFDKCVKYMGWNEEDQQFNLSVSLSHTSQCQQIMTL